jgi:nucleoside 2-deoxyribosyltransferase
MARLKSPLCFVAMAFGKKDTDSFYNYLLLPTLKRNNIRPVIINRRQSNDDLNIQIIEQLRLADICIVDLTYARPSVYFEAGVAQQRGIPVISL